MLYRVDVFLSDKIGHIMQKVHDELKNTNTNHDDVMISVEIVAVIDVKKQEVRQLELFQ
jgi:hypothetical protein